MQDIVKLQVIFNPATFCLIFRISGFLNYFFIFTICLKYFTGRINQKPGIFELLILKFKYIIEK